jgi:hypothetical protein
MPDSNVQPGPGPQPTPQPPPTTIQVSAPPNAAPSIFSTGIQQASWFARFFAYLTPQQGQSLAAMVYMVASLVLIGWGMYQWVKMMDKQQTSNEEQINQIRRDKDVSEEKCHQNETAHINAILAAWTKMVNDNRTESRVHMKNAFEELEKLRLSIDRFSRAKGIPEDDPNDPVVAPLPRIKAHQD